MESANKLMDGATYYSNEVMRDATTGEITVLSQINGSKQITEISFIDGTKNDNSNNYNDIFNQMVSFFKPNESTFKSPNYDKADVVRFTRDKNYYYAFKKKNTPTIIISNYTIDEEYFGKE